jgi:hypothetical protein
MQSPLSFGKGNAKLGKFIATFSLPAGYACPGASQCLAKANRETGVLTDGPNALFRCFSASSEALFPSVRLQRWKNFEALKSQSSAIMAHLIKSSLPSESIIRIHVSGDFFSQDYFDAWLNVAKNTPEKTFYAYTKSINFWVARLPDIPTNFKLNASVGGKYDGLITEHNLKSAIVVFTEQQAKDLNLEIDHDDTHAYQEDKSFALLLHGTQAKGSQASKALSTLRSQGKGGYSNNKEKHLVHV